MQRMHSLIKKKKNCHSYHSINHFSYVQTDHQARFNSGQIDTTFIWWSRKWIWPFFVVSLHCPFFFFFFLWFCHWCSIFITSFTKVALTYTLPKGLSIFETFVFIPSASAIYLECWCPFKFIMKDDQMSCVAYSQAVTHPWNMRNARLNYMEKPAVLPPSP